MLLEVIRQDDGYLAHDTLLAQDVSSLSLALYHVTFVIVGATDGGLNGLLDKGQADVHSAGLVRLLGRCSLMDCRLSLVSRTTTIVFIRVIITRTVHTRALPMIFPTSFVLGVALLLVTITIIAYIRVINGFRRLSRYQARLRLDAVPLVPIGLRGVWVILLVLLEARGIDMGSIAAVLIVKIPGVEVRYRAASLCRLDDVDGALEGHFLRAGGLVTVL